MRLPEEQDVPFQINIVPMIDVIFSILAFVIISSLSLTRSEGLPVNLPSATTAQQQESTEITVTIEPNGKISLNKEPIELEKLQDAVSSLTVPNAQSLVIVNADKAVEHGQVVDVMDRLRQVENVKLAIAANKD